MKLSNCVIKDKAFLCLKELKCLEHLNLCNTRIGAKTLCKVLQENRRVRELNLTLGLNLDAVTIQLKNSCRNLEVINLRLAIGFTSQGINALADCKNLRKVNLQ